MWLVWQSRSQPFWTFYFWGWVFGDLEDIFCILDGDYAIWDDYLVFELIYFVFLLVYLVCWAAYVLFGNTPVCILDAVFCFFEDFLVFWMVHFRGPTVRGPICHFFGADSWALDNWAPGPNFPRTAFFLQGIQKKKCKPPSDRPSTPLPQKL